MENTALAIIENAQKAGALVYINKENFQSKVQLYRTEVTQIVIPEKEYHVLSGSKYEPAKGPTDRIGEAAGIIFIKESSTERLVHYSKSPIYDEHDAWIVTAQGKVLMPDGSWRESDVEAYEFDPIVRAMEDMKVAYIDDKNRGEFSRKVLTYMKFALARAHTGARLRVIRSLTGLPSSFEKDQVGKPMFFARTVMNTEHILSTPEGRTMATAKALGMDVSSLLFGKKPDPAQAIAASTEPNPSSVEPENLRSANEPEAETETAADTASLASQANPGGEDRELENLSVELEALINENRSVIDFVNKQNINVYEKAQEELRSFVPTIESRKDMLKKVTAYVEAMKAAIAKGATA